MPDPEDLFGQPSDLLAQEAVWLYREEQGSWPTLPQAIDSLASFPSIPTRREADVRIAQAICEEDVTPRLRSHGRGHSFVLELPEEACDRIARRMLALRTAPIPDEEAPC